ncbi:hypothetical protein V8C86DRAFT_652734 [Haematococcus lacustris]
MMTITLACVTPLGPHHCNHPPSACLPHLSSPQLSPAQPSPARQASKGHTAGCGPAVHLTTSSTPLTTPTCYQGWGRAEASPALPLPLPLGPAPPPPCPCLLLSGHSGPGCGGAVPGRPGCCRHCVRRQRPHAQQLQGGGQHAPRLALLRGLRGGVSLHHAVLDHMAHQAAACSPAANTPTTLQPQAHNCHLSSLMDPPLQPGQ